jgi:hypothetical protein
MVISSTTALASLEISLSSGGVTFGLGGSWVIERAKPEVPGGRCSRSATFCARASVRAARLGPGCAKLADLDVEPALRNRLTV